MNTYVKEFIKRGLMFSGLGPIVYGIVIMILGFSKVELELSGLQILLGIVSTYLLAFIQAGSSIFEQIDSWSTAKTVIIHGLSIYLAYLLTYVLNSWIPFKLSVVCIFSAGVILGFLLIWIICYAFAKRNENMLNSKIN